MNGCIKNKRHTVKDFGVAYKTKCGKEIFKNDLCKKHYNKHLSANKKNKI